MSTFAGTSSNDFIIPTANGVDYRGGQGDDTYIISALIPAGAVIAITDTEGANKIQLADGLTIASSLFLNNAVELTLSNGAKIQITGASSFTYDLGANATAGDVATAPNQAYASFATALGATVPAAGAPAVAGATNAVVNPNGSVTAGGVVVPPGSTYALTAGAASADEGTTATFNLVTTGLAAGAQVAYTLSGIDAADLASGALTGMATVGADGKATISVALAADNKTEGAETLTVTAGGKTASTVVNDTSKALTFTLTATKAEINEGEANTFTVTASEAVAVDTEVTFQLALGTAQLEDFNAGAFNAQKVVIKAGEKTATHSITAITNDGTELTETYKVTASVAGQQVSSVDVSILDGSTGAGQIFVLTKEQDVIPSMKGSNGNTVTAGNDTIIGAIDAVGATPNASTFQALDLIDGGQGIDTLKLNDASGATISLANVSNVEIIEVQGSAGVTIDTSTVAGVTNLNITKQGSAKVDATAAATTDIAVTVKEDNAGGSTLANVIKGGNNVTVTGTDLGAAATQDTITVGGAGALAAAGNVVVNATGAKSVAATDKTLSAVTVTGGKTISVTQKASSDASAAATDKVGTTITQGGVTVTGNASTTTVTVKQDASVAEVLAVDAVAAKAATQEVSFSAMTKGQILSLDFGAGALTFTANKDLTAAEAASAFANLAAGAKQGNAAASFGIYTDATAGGATTGVTDGWTSGAVQTVSTTVAKVVFSNSTATATGVVNPAAISNNAAVTTATAPVAGGLTAGTAVVAAKAGVLGVANSVVLVDDHTTAGLKTITIDGYANTSRIGTTNDTTVLETLNLSNSGLTFNGAGKVTAAAGITVDDTAATLALNLEKVGFSGYYNNDAGVTTHAGAVALTLAPTTLNVKSTGNNYVNLTADLTETLNVSGTGLLDASTADLLALKTIKVTETAGLKLNALVSNSVTSVDTTGTTGTVTVTIKGDTATYTGGAGVDNVSVDNASTAISKAIDLGAGNDRLDLSTATTVTPTVELKGGDGTDTLVLKSADAASLAAGTAFEAKITSFEKLEVTQTLAGARDSINLDNLDDISYVITNGQAAGAGGTKEVQGFTVTSGVTAKQVNATQTIDFTGVLVGVAGAGNITVGGVTVALANSANAAAIAGAVAAALNGQTAGTTQVVKAGVAGNVVTVTFDTRDGAFAALAIGAGTAVLDGTSTVLPVTATAGTAYSANAQTITLGGVTVAGLVAQHADKDGTAVAATGDDASAVATKIVAALDLNATYVAADTANVAAAVTLKFAADGDQAPVALTAGTTGVTIGAVTETNGAVSTQLNLTKMLDNGTVELKKAGVLTVVEMKDATGLADSLNILANALTADGALGTVQVNKVETVNITANDTDVTTAVNAITDAVTANVSTNTLTLAADKAATVTVGGAGNLTLTLDATSTAVTLIDGSLATGKLNVTTLASDLAATTVKGGSAVDTLVAQGANDVLIGGAGNDVLKVVGGIASAVTLTGGDGVDQFDVSGFLAANAGAAATITDFTKGETIKFANSVNANFASSKVSLIAEATFDNYVTEAAKAADAGNGAATTHGVAWFQFGGNTFVVQDVGGVAGAFDNGTDIIVKITGLVDLSASSFNEVGQGTLLFI